MAPVKIKIFNTYNSFVALLLSLLGFTSSCAEDEVRFMYGTPHADFIVKGKVEAVSGGQAIPEIIVEVRDSIGPNNVRLVQTGYSQTDGRFAVKVTDFPGDHTYQLKFVDTDGALNGDFETRDTTVVFKDPVFEGGDNSWYSGSTEKELNIQLKAKQ